MDGTSRVADIVAAYARDASALAARYAEVDPAAKFAAVAEWLPAAPGAVLDVGAGVGSDAAWLAACGHRVCAVEPVAAFREAGQRLYPEAGITWCDDALPALAKVVAPEGGFALVLAAAVWGHVPPEDAPLAMRRLAALLAPGGVLVLSLRFGPTHPDRPMHAMPAEAVVALAGDCGLTLTADIAQASQQAHNRHAGVHWRWLVLARGAGA